MSRKLPVISGEDMVKYLVKQGFTVRRQTSSHIIVQKVCGKSRGFDPVGDPGAGPICQYEHTLGRAGELQGRDHTVSVGEGSSGDLSGWHFSGLIRQNAGLII